MPAFSITLIEAAFSGHATATMRSSPSCSKPYSRLARLASVA
jgi:hypothetical protein